MGISYFNNILLYPVQLFSIGVISCKSFTLFYQARLNSIFPDGNGITK